MPGFHCPEVRFDFLRQPFVAFVHRGRATLLFVQIGPDGVTTIEFLRTCRRTPCSPTPSSSSRPSGRPPGSLGVDEPKNGGSFGKTLILSEIQRKLASPRLLLRSSGSI